MNGCFAEIISLTVFGAKKEKSIRKHPQRTQDIYITERQYYSLIIDNNMEQRIVLRAIPLISCHAYLFAYLTYEGISKAILYHVTSSGPHKLVHIVQTIADETDLSKVSVIIATPRGNEQQQHLDDVRIKEALEGWYLEDVYYQGLKELGLTRKPVIVRNAEEYYVDNHGGHGHSHFLHELELEPVTRPSQAESDSSNQPCCALF